MRKNLDYYFATMYNNIRRKYMKSYENIVVKKQEVSSVIQPSKQEDFDFVINPYTGCPNPCKYCYASFMRRFSRHSEQWGEFVDIKIWNGTFDAKRLEGKSILISSVTEPYNFYEKKYKVTQNILKKLIGIDCKIVINTKSGLVSRDIDILKKLKDVTISMSFCTLDEKIAKDLEESYSVKERLQALAKLHENGIKTCVNIAPIFPELTDWRAIVDKTREFTNEFSFESLTLRNEFKPAILNYIWANHKDLYATYYEIYKENRSSYFDKLFDKIDCFCEEEGLKHKISLKL